METGKKINHLALWPALALLAVLIGFGVFKTEALGSLLTTILYGMANSFGWFFCLFTIIAIILTFVLAFSKIGSIKIGGPDATPDYKTWNWITMSLCGGIGTGLLFWAMGEPMYHFMTPPVAAGVEGGSRRRGHLLHLPDHVAVVYPPVLPVHHLRCGFRTHCLQRKKASGLRPCAGFRHWQKVQRS